MPTSKDTPRKNRPRRRLIDGALLFIIFLALASGGAVWARDGSQAVLSAAIAEASLLTDLVPRMAAALLLAGFMQVLLPHDKVGRWLGAQSGMRGLILASLAGGLAPGGPMASFPLAVALFGAGADIGAVVAFVTSWSVLGINRVLIWEIPFLGGEFALLREVVSLPLPVIAGLLVRQLPLGSLTLPEPSPGTSRWREKP